MSARPFSFVAASTLIVLAGCNSGGSSGSATAMMTTSGSVSTGNLAERFQSLQGDPNAGALTPNDTVQNMSGSATYAGVANMSVNSAGYLGDVSMQVDFSNDRFSGNAGNFQRYGSLVASSANGQAVSGSFTMSGQLTGDNEAIGDGLSGSANGTLDGTTVDMEVGGNITGLNGEGASLYFDANTGQGGGVAILAR